MSTSGEKLETMKIASNKVPFSPGKPREQMDYAKHYSAQQSISRRPNAYEDHFGVSPRKYHFVSFVTFERMTW